MKKFRITAIREVSEFIDVQAENETQAYELANNADNNEWKEGESTNWSIVDAKEINN